MYQTRLKSTKYTSNMYIYMYYHN